MLIAQITDLHVTLRDKPLQGIVDTAAYLEQAVAKLRAINPNPDVVLITGDLVDNAAAAEYQLLRSIIAPLTMPVYVIPGNHDDRDELRRAFSNHAYLPKQGFLQYAIEDFPVRLIALDTVIPQQAGGKLCPERLAWLDAILKHAPEKPTLIFMHHPPFATGIAHMDSVGLANPGEFAEIIERHPQVERIVCGHVHRAIQMKFAGTLALTCPSAAHQIEFAIAADAPGAFIMEPPALMLHLWNGKFLATHTLYTDHYDGPYVYE